MNSKPVSDPAMRSLERRIRFDLEKLLLIITVVCLILEIGIAIYYYIIQDLGQPLKSYIEFRILVPLGINVLVYLVTRFSNRSENSTDSTKNRVCSFSLLIMMGVISLAHSFFIPLWTLPLFSIMFCSIFHDGFIQKIQGGVCVVFILYSGILHMYDYPTERSFTILCIVISEILALVVSYMSYKLELYNTSKFLISERNLTSMDKFEHGFETDSVTGVYSRTYLTEEAEKILEKTNELDPCGVAVIDIDDFKKINDELGNDKGDDVLRALGVILQDYIDEDTIIGRYGGDTFVIIFENGSRDENLDVLNKIRREFSKKRYSFMKESVTVSGGYSWFDVTMDLKGALAEVDKALLNAKKSGKNRIMSSGESEEII
ncbi:MAG: GGDEF domain-containing protein [Clostridiales bacterium]|nr:GGDEF domain-containing protein [Clostridiales bacterium]